MNSCLKILKSYARTAVTALLAFFIGLFVGNLFSPKKPISGHILPPVDTTTTVTPIVDDSPTPVSSGAHAGFVSLPVTSDTVRIRDTVFIRVPRTETVYQTPAYSAVVSGVDARLDQITVFQKTTTVNVPYAVPYRNRIGVEATAGFFPGNATASAGIVWDRSLTSKGRLSATVGGGYAASIQGSGQVATGPYIKAGIRLDLIRK